jgi:hypothetical protein
MTRINLIKMIPLILTNKKELILRYVVGNAEYS